MEHFNRLTPAEAERLALLAEECGEVMQAIGKVLRHGFESTHPDGGPTNRDALERECGDVYHAIWRLIGAGDIDGNGMSQRADDKAKSVVRYLHHQGHNVKVRGCALLRSPARLPGWAESQKPYSRSTRQTRTRNARYHSFARP